MRGPSQQERELTQVLAKQHNQLWDKFSTSRSTGESLRRLILPNHAELLNQQMIEGIERTDDVYSSTATIAAPRLAAHLAGNVTPSRIQYFEFPSPARNIQDLADEDKNWLQDEPAALFTSLNNSNYFGESLKFWLSIVAYGTGATLSDEHPSQKGEFIFHTVPFGKYVIDEGIDGKLARFDWRFQWPLSRIVSMWGLDKLSQSWQAMFKSDPFQLVTITQVIKQADKDDYELGVPKIRKIASHFLDLENKHIINTGSYHEMPAHVGRWYQMAGEDMGRGCGHDVLADVRSENEVARLALNNLALSVSPPHKAKIAAVQGRPIFRPNSIVWVESMDDIDEMGNKTRLDIQQYGQERLALSINRAFFQDIINVTQNPNQGRTPVSATQINANIQHLLPVIGPYLSKIEHEYIIPQLGRCFNIRNRANLVSPMPPNLQALYKAQGGIANVAIKGPVAKSIQRTSLESIDAVLTRFNTLSPVWPGFIDRLNVERTANMIIESENAPTEMTNTNEELQAIMEQRAQQEAEAKEDEGLERGSQVVKNMGGLQNEAQ